MFAKKMYLLYNYKNKKELHKMVFSHHGITYQHVTEFSVIFAYYTEYLHNVTNVFNVSSLT